MLEGVFEIGKEPELVNEFGGLKAREAAAQILIGTIGDAREERLRHVLADDRGRLQELLVFGLQAVDARGDDRVNRAGYLDPDRVLAEAIGAALADEDPGVDQRAHALFEEERIALRAFDQEAAHGRRGRDRRRAAAAAWRPPLSGGSATIWSCW